MIRDAVKRWLDDKYGVSRCHPHEPYWGICIDDCPPIFLYESHVYCTLFEIPYHDPDFFQKFQDIIEQAMATWNRY